MTEHKPLCSFVSVQYHDTTLPVSKKIVSVRRYKHGDVKNVLTIYSEFREKRKGKGKAMFTTVANLIQACLKDQTIDVRKLDIADFTWLMCYLKQISKSERTTYRFKCNSKDSNDKICGEITEVDFKLDDVVILNNESPQKESVEIELDAETKAVLAVHPYTFNTMINNAQIFEGEITDKDLMAKFFVSFIDSVEIVRNGETIEHRDNLILPEMIAFIDELSEEQLAPLNSHINNRPKLYWKTEFECKRCGEICTGELTEVIDFF